MVTIDFNGKNSYTDYDIILEEKPAIPLTLENIESISIEGRSGTLTRRLGTYNDKTIVCKFMLLSKTGLARRIDSVISWLNYITDSNLKFSFDTDRVYKVKSVTVAPNIQETLSFYGKFEVTFVCDPFKYPVSESVTTKYVTSFTITNNGNMKSEPYIKITGSGAISITINGRVTNFSNVSGYIEIDSKTLMCYKGTTNQMSIMSGDFPYFDIGSNTVVIGGSMGQIDITQRTRYL